MKLLLPILCAVSVAPALALAGETPKEEQSCIQRQISMPYRMDMLPIPRTGISDPSVTATNNFATRLNTATESRLAGRKICVPVNERSAAPTKLVRVTLGRGVTAWKAVPAEQD